MALGLTLHSALGEVSWDFFAVRQGSRGPCSETEEALDRTGLRAALPPQRLCDIRRATSLRVDVQIG